MLPALLPVACVHCPACCPEPRLVMPRLLSEPLLPLLLLPSLPPPLELLPPSEPPPPPSERRAVKSSAVEPVMM